MRDHRDAKAMAHTLREAFSEKSIAISHSESLELVARMLGVADWNTLSARIQADREPVEVETIDYPAIPIRDFVPFPMRSLPQQVDATRPRFACDALTQFRVRPVDAGAPFQVLSYAHPMADEPDNLVLAFLRRMDVKLDNLAADMLDVKRRLTSIEGQVASVHCDFAGQSLRLDRVESRLAVIERCLDLVQ